MDSDDLVARIEDQLGQGPSVPASSISAAPPNVPDHTLLRRIGSGSYGEVWLARAVTGQFRAVKVVARSRFSSDRPYEREFRGVVRFEPISRTHSGLIQVLHVGRDEKAAAFYYVMELADSAGRGPGETEVCLPNQYTPRTLRSELQARGRLPVQEAVALGVELAGALGHIHRHDLVHRDVKPSNVIFINGQPKLADLGLVTGMDEARSFVGTEGFIPPEGPGTVKADLFALGRLLYEAVTGKDRCEFPELPANLDAWPDREMLLEINEVLTQLCAPDPVRRYDHAAEVAGDLNLILAGRSVRRAMGLERRLRQARRVAMGALAVLIAAAAAVWFEQSRRVQAEAQARHERSLRERAEEAEEESRQQLCTALLEQARATVRSGEMGQRWKALDAIRRAAAFTNTPSLRREALIALGLPDARLERQWPVNSQCTIRELDPRFERIALGEAGGPVEIRRVPDGALLETLPASTNRGYHAAIWNADGRFLAIRRDRDGGGYRSSLEVWDLRSKPTRALWVSNAVWKAAAFHPLRPQFLSGTEDGRLSLWDLESRTEVTSTNVPVMPWFFAYSPAGDRLATSHPAERGWAVSIHRADDGSELALHRQTNYVAAFAWHPGGRWLALVDHGGDVQLMDSFTGATELLGHHSTEAVTVMFDPRGEYLVSGGWERALVVWNFPRRQRAFTIEQEATVAQFRSDGGGLALKPASAILFYTFERPTLLRELNELTGLRLRQAAFSADGRWLAASSSGGLGVWDLTHPGPGATTNEPVEARLAWNRDGTRLVGSAPNTQSGVTWRVQPAPNPTAPPHLEVEAPWNAAGLLSISANSNRIAWTGRRGSKVTSWDELDYDEQDWVPTGNGINGLSRDGRWLGIFSSRARELRLFELPSLQPAARLEMPGAIAGFSFSPQGDELAVLSFHRAEFRRVGTWEIMRVSTNFVGLFDIGLLYQADGRSFWVDASIRNAGLFDAQTFESLLPLQPGMSPLALSTDGTQLAVCIDRRLLQVWNLTQVWAALRELGLAWPGPPLVPRSP